MIEHKQKKLCVEFAKNQSWKEYMVHRTHGMLFKKENNPAKLRREYAKIYPAPTTGTIHLQYAKNESLDSINDMLNQPQDR